MFPDVEYEIWMLRLSVMDYGMRAHERGDKT
jgi:hypothetical protein